MLKELVDPQEAWTLFRERHDISKKEEMQVVRRLVREKLFWEGCLRELEDGNDEEQKAITMF